MIRMLRPHRPALLHVCGRYLPLSETFTYDLITGLDAFDHHVVAGEIENLHAFPLAQVSVPEPEERAWSLARTVDARAIVCHFGPQATMGMPIALALGRPAVTIFHGYDISRLLRDRRWVERYRAVARLGMQAICISAAGRERLIEIGWPDTQVRVIHLGVDVARFPFTPLAERWGRRQPRRILMVARLVEKKGVHVALDAMRRLHTEGHAFELRIIGDGPERPRLETLIAEWGLSNVTLLGALEHEHTRQEFAGAGIYIQPSITAASGDQEGIPVSLMEAQACGIPVVSTRHSGIPELVRDGETGWLTDEGDSAGLAAAIVRLVRNPDEARRFSEAGRAHVEEEFDRRRQTQRISAHLATLAADPARRPATYRARLPRPSCRGLVIAPIPLGLTARKLLLLAQRYPDVRWDLLIDRASCADTRQVPLAADIYLHQPGRLSLRRVGVDLLSRLRANDYDAIVAMSPDESVDGLAHTRRVASEVGARRTIVLTMRDLELPFPLRRPRLHLAPPADEPLLSRGA